MYILVQCHFLSALQLISKEIQNLTLVEIEKYLQTNRKTLKDFPSMSFLKGHVTTQFKEHSYNVARFQNEFQQLFA